MNQDRFQSSTRRDFLRTVVASGSVLGLGIHSQRPAVASSANIQELDVRIDRALRMTVHYTRPRIVAGNSQYRLAGGKRSESVVLLFGNNGQIGVGSCHGGANADDGQFLVGKTVSELLQNDLAELNRRVGSSACWDLAGKSLGKPVYQLMGGRMPDGGVPVYDGSIYHEELLSRDNHSAYRDRDAKYGGRPGWDDIIRDAIDHSLQGGHNFVKVKIGRGSLHLSRLAGNYQDLAVLRLIREHAGNDFGVGVDANNGYRLKDTLWLLEQTKDLDLAFIEEMFPDNSEQYREVQSKISELGTGTLIADGESWNGPDDALAEQIIQSGTVDIVQGDIRRFQMEGIIKESEMAIAAGYGTQIAPHNWASEFGFYMQMHVACVIPNFYRAEQDPGDLEGEALVRYGYDIQNGYCKNFDAPGFGIEVNKKRLSDLKSDFDVKA